MLFSGQSQNSSIDLPGYPSHKILQSIYHKNSPNTFTATDKVSLPLLQVQEILPRPSQNAWHVPWPSHTPLWNTRISIKIFTLKLHISVIVTVFPNNIFTCYKITRRNNQNHLWMLKFNWQCALCADVCCAQDAQHSIKSVSPNVKCVRLYFFSTFDAMHSYI